MYKSFRKGELILWDLLTSECMILTAERTFLAYVRTEIAFLATGASLVRFFDALAGTSFSRHHEILSEQSREWLIVKWYMKAESLQQARQAGIKGIAGCE